MPALGPLFEARFGIPPSEPGAAEQEVSKGGVVGGMLQRGVLRSFDTSRPVEPALLEMLLACAQSAPSKSDLNQYSIIVVRDQAKKDYVASLLPSMAWIADSAVFFLFCADCRRGKLVTEHHELEHDSDSASLPPRHDCEAVSFSYTTCSLICPHFCVHTVCV
jgi:nitroreductase/FMN reductase [NAD(P)H]